MLWHKGWLETRFKVMLSLCFLGIFLITFYSMRNVAPPPGAKPAANFSLAAMGFMLVTYTWLAGAGIATQAAFQAIKGLHGSTLFTLSLPVSRLRLLTVRASLGWLEMAALLATFCGGMWLAVPVVRRSATAMDMVEYAVALVACGSSLYSLSVLFATFLEEQWRMFAGLLTFAALAWLSSNTPLPASVNIFRAMEEGSPLLTHTMPLGAMAFSLGLAVLLFFASLRIVQSREY